MKILVSCGAAETMLWVRRLSLEASYQDILLKNDVNIFRLVNDTLAGCGMFFYMPSPSRFPFRGVSYTSIYSSGEHAIKSLNLLSNRNVVARFCTPSA